MIPKNISKNDIDKGFEHYDEVGLPDSHAQSTYYDVVRKGKKYPPKVIISYANIYTNGEQLDRNSFDAQQAFKVLKENGYEVIKKSNYAKYDSGMLSKSLAISKAIVNNKLSKKTIRKNTDEHTAYYKKVKPLLDEFRKSYGKSPNLILSEILKQLFEENEFSNNYEVKNFKYWGRILQPYVWACISLKDSKGRGNPASYSPQIYIAIDYNLIRFGFCYGDYLQDTDELVFKVKNDNNLLEEIYDFLNNKDQLGYFDVPNEGILEIAKDAVAINSKNELKDFWNANSHLSGYIHPKDVNEDSINEIVGRLNLLINMFKKISDSSDNILKDQVVIGESNDKLINNSLHKGEKEMIKELNTIYYGPPGTGKTFKYKTDIKPQFPGRIEFVTFHQSFSYEDFIEGIKPVLGDENPTIDSDIDVNSENELYDVIKQDFQSGNFALDDMDINSCTIVQKALRELKHSEHLNHNDLLMLFKLTLGTWKLSIKAKKEAINQSSLSTKSQTNLIDELKNESGLFGTGTYTIKIGDEISAEILNVLIMVNNSKNRDKTFKELETFLKNNWENMKGFGIGMLSQILYCAKPQWFPILNTWGRDVYKNYLKVKLTSHGHHIGHYMENVGIITKFRDTFFPEFDNYRYFDKIFFDTEKYETIINNEALSESNGHVEVPSSTVNNQNGLQYHIVPGVFKRICDRAKQDSKNNYAIFIDEINRGNIANIFGELITLIEPDKRQDRANTIEVTLPYSKELFSVPDNLYIIGTMNTADRSIEALDTALRRRFSFIEMPPDITLLKGKNIDGVTLDLLLETINLRIEKLIDKDHQIGHSYFLDINSINELKGVFRNKIMPLLQEYFFGNYNRIGLVLGKAFVKENPPVQFADGFSDEDDLYEERRIFKIQSPEDLTAADFINIYSDKNAN